MENYDAMVTAMGTGVYMVSVIISLVISVLTIIAMWKIFKKAGKPGWASIIPFYNTYCLFDLAWGNGWLFLLSLVPCVNIVVMIMLYFKLAKAFGKGTAFGFGLLFLNTIFFLILGFGNAEYVGPQK
ncbi:MAG: DUF5684 domain-containing protein [Lachnospiraceae bacterium]|nr:DUF5684 domain-containing protein [Lachnospiraceae bacterium]